MRSVPWWARFSASAAPALLIGGWTLGAARQPAGFDASRDTISALAAHGATDRWIMTSALAGLGVSHAVTALGLRPAALPGRIALAVGGLANIAVAAFPQPDGGGSSPAHVRAATVGFVALAIWPALAGRRDRPGASGVSFPVGLAASVALLGALGWFAVELYGDGDLVGRSERVVAAAEALWPLLVVIAASRVSARRE